ncbi:MAG: chorismate synthase [Thermoprotei archaeon]|nr:MAG: chorismate synthase [Thermoprotei archaeon]
MSGNVLGRVFRVISFGESHGKCVGVVIDGCPAGLRLDFKEIQRELNRRRPNQSGLTSSRNEEDRFEILSGIFNGFTTGAPICIVVWNKDVDSSKYEMMRFLPRPGHADLTANIKFGGFSDYRGGGRFSGRITVGFVIAGSIAKQILRKFLGIEVVAHTVQIGKVKARKVSFDEIKENVEKNSVRCADLEAAKKMEEIILEAKRQGDSVGGIIECIAFNVPPGLGEPVFDTLEGDLSKALFAIPAVKGVEFGAGFKLTEMRGSQSNDEYLVKDGKIVTRTNNCGGILGGISNGMPIVCRVVIKPTSSIRKPQKTVNLKTMEAATLTVDGRHDPCIVPRAVPVVESMVAIVLVDHCLLSNIIPRVIKDG